MFAGVKLETPDYQYSDYVYSSAVGVKCEWLGAINDDEPRRPCNKRTRIVYDSDSDCSVEDYFNDGYEQPLKKSLKLEHLDEEEDEDLTVNQSETDFVQLLWREDMDNLSNMMRNIMEPTEVYPVKVEGDDVVNCIPSSQLFFDDDLPDLDDEELDEDDVDDDDSNASVPRGISDASDDGMDDDDIEVTTRKRPWTPVDADADCFQDSIDSVDLPYPVDTTKLPLQPRSPEPDLIVMSPEPPKAVEIIDLDDDLDTIRKPPVVTTPEPQKPHHPLTPPPTPKPETKQPRWKSLPFMRLKKEPATPVDVIDLCDSSDEEVEVSAVKFPEIPVEDEIVISSSEDEGDGGNSMRILRNPDCLPPSPESSDNHEVTRDAPQEVVPGGPAVEPSPCPSPEEEEAEVEEEVDGPTLPKLVTVMNPWMWTRRNVVRHRSPTDFTLTETQLMNSAFENDKSLRLACSTARTLTTPSHRPTKKVKLKFLDLLSESADRERTDRCYGVLRHILRHHAFCGNKDIWTKLNGSVQRVRTELKCGVPSESLRANALCISIITQSVEENLRCCLLDNSRLQKGSSVMSGFFSSKLETLVDWLRWCIVEKWTGYECEKMETVKCFQLLIALPLLVCQDPFSHAGNLARSFGLVYVNLPSLEDRTVMLSTIRSPLLLVQLLTNVLDCSESSMNTLPKSLIHRYSSHLRSHLSLDKIVHYYFFMSPLHRPPTCNEPNGRGHAVAVEELAMILNMLLSGYFLCKQEKYIRCADEDDDRACLGQLSHLLRALKVRFLARNRGVQLSERTAFLLDSMGRWTDS